MDVDQPILVGEGEDIVVFGVIDERRSNHPSRLRLDCLGMWMASRRRPLSRSSALQIERL